MHHFNFKYPVAKLPLNIIKQTLIQVNTALSLSLIDPIQRTSTRGTHLLSHAVATHGRTDTLKQPEPHQSITTG